MKTPTRIIDAIRTTSLAVTFAFFFNSTTIAQQHDFEVSFLCEDTAVVQKADPKKVAVHAGEKLLKLDVDYKIEGEKVKIISEEYLQYSGPISIGFQKTNPSKKEQSTIEGKQKE